MQTKYVTIVVLVKRGGGVKSSTAWVVSETGAVALGETRELFGMGFFLMLDLCCFVLE